ncbi:unnamed protein product [Pleuronectes platessa]|uniref:Uncharacterized protein n=1 Tax=Pleuronectes platessa TaxID=8262 RepID=A0A9N7VLN7_PLEPL|nr:unnamed protein product [Pleuronectes platessa]
MDSCLCSQTLSRPSGASAGIDMSLTRLRCSVLGSLGPPQSRKLPKLHISSSPTGDGILASYGLTPTNASGGSVMGNPTEECDPAALLSGGLSLLTRVTDEGEAEQEEKVKTTRHHTGKILFEEADVKKLAPVCVLYRLVELAQNERSPYHVASVSLVSVLGEGSSHVAL